MYFKPLLVVCGEEIRDEQREAIVVDTDRSRVVGVDGVEVGGGGRFNGVVTGEVISCPAGAFSLVTGDKGGERDGASLISSTLSKSSFFGVTLLRPSPFSVGASSPKRPAPSLSPVKSSVRAFMAFSIPFFLFLGTIPQTSSTGLRR
jgi:hypothetical protein